MFQDILVQFSDIKYIVLHIFTQVTVYIHSP